MFQSAFNNESKGFTQVQMYGNVVIRDNTKYLQKHNFSFFTSRIDEVEKLESCNLKNQGIVHRIACKNSAREILQSWNRYKLFYNNPKYIGEIEYYRQLKILMDPFVKRGELIPKEDFNAFITFYKIRE